LHGTERHHNKLYLSLNELGHWRIEARKRQTKGFVERRKRKWGRR
jgi:hypothetical protein